MKKKLFNNILISFIALFIIIIINFFLPRLINGNPLNALAGLDGNLNEEVIKELTLKYGLDKPLINQFFIYLGNIFKFDLGFSYQSNLSVRELIFTKIGNTLEISIISIIISSFIAYFIASRAGFKKDNNHLDKTFSILNFINTSIPSFIISMFILFIFSYKLHLFPSSGLQSIIVPSNPFLAYLDRLYHLILPIICLVIVSFPSTYLLIKNLVIKEKNKNYVRYLISKGEKERIIIDKNILPNIIGPIIIQIGLRFSFVFGGSLIIENIFSIRGVGTLLTQSIYKLDYPVIQGILLVSASFAVLINIIIDIIGIVIDPRIRRNSYEN